MKIVFTALLVAVTSAFSIDSRLGHSLIQNARELNNRNNNKNQDLIWMTNYSVHFDMCHTITQVQDDGKDGSKSYTQHLAEFSLCPSNACKSGCRKGGKYVVDMKDFVQAYIETKEEAEKEACKTARENCGETGDGAQDSCYAKAGLQYCNDGDGQQDFNIDRYMQCQAMENKNNKNNNNKNNNNNNNKNSAYYSYESYTQYYIGPYCSSNGKYVYLGVFLDEGCSVAAPSGAFEKMYNTTLPYSKTSLVQGDCVSCDGGEDGSGVSGVCSSAYEESIKCETNLQNGPEYPDTSACDYIQTTLPRQDKASKSAAKAATKSANASRSTSKSGMPKVTGALAWVFGLTTVLLSVYAFLLYRRLKRSKVALNGA